MSGLRQISTLPSSIDELSAIATSEGFGMLETLISNFKSATNSTVLTVEERRSMRCMSKNG